MLTLPPDVSAGVCVCVFLSKYCPSGLEETSPVTRWVIRLSQGTFTANHHQQSVHTHGHTHRAHSDVTDNLTHTNIQTGI